MPQRSQHKMQVNGLEKWVWTRFHQTPAISSYLVAFFVGKLEPRETHTKNGTPFKVWARPAVVAQGKYALDIGPRIIDFFSRLLGVSEPLPKQDVLALPRFIADALENWGLISFGLSPNGTQSQCRPSRRSCMFFPWIPFIRHILSPFPYRTSMICDRYSTASLTTKVGFYVLRMLNHSLGESTFLEGCKRYVQRNRYRAVDAQDLWDALTEQSHNDHVLPSHLHLSQLMASWIQEPGFPVLNVTRNYTNEPSSSQTRFQRPREDVEGRHKQTAWWIPLTYTTGDDTDFNSTKPRLWMSPDHGDLELKDLPGPEHWLLLNIQAAGLYRVNYDIHNWELIARFLDSPRFEEMAVLNRALILDDALDLARVGLLSYKTALNQFIQQLIEPQFKKLGFEPHKNDTYLKSLHHKEIVTWACLTGVRSCVQKATDLFKRWSEGQRNVIPRSLRGVVYCTAVEHGGKVEWQKLWEHYKNSSVPSERNSALLALGCTQDIQQLKRYVEWAGQKNSGVKPGDSTTVFKAVASTDAGFGVAKEFLFENVDNIVKTVGHFFLPEILETIASRMNQPQHLQELEEFQRKNAAKLQSFTRSVNQMNERVQYNIQWLNNNYEDIHKWLKTRLTAK
ncbi:hypothetical protein C0J52_04712 [Blattella germanica]|nr:hypothetical protein C0J52_04712 [Blattella germanica]